MLNVIISIMLFIILVFFLNKNALEEEKKGYKIVAGIAFLVFSINWNINKDPRIILVLMIAIWIKQCSIKDTYKIEHEKDIIDYNISVHIFYKKYDICNVRELIINRRDQYERLFDFNTNMDCYYKCDSNDIGNCSSIRRRWDTFI